MYKCHKLFTIFGYEKERKWLNEMSSKGFQLINVDAFTYTFEEGLPNEYQYDVEYPVRIGNSDENEEYLRSLNEMGVELIPTKKDVRYFRRRMENTEFKLHNSAKLRVKLYRLYSYPIYIISILAFASLITQVKSYGLSKEVYESTKRLQEMGIDVNSWSEPNLIGIILCSTLLLLNLYLLLRLEFEIRKLKKDIENQKL